MSIILTKAKPYAKAVFDLALNQNKLRNSLRTLKLLAEFAIEIKKNQDIDGPTINPEQKMELFSDVTNKSQEFKTLIKILVERKKLHLLPDIASSYLQMFLEYKKVLKIKIVSAEKLSSDQKIQLLDTLKKRYQNKIILQCLVDNKLIGGAVLYIGDKVIDASVKSMILRLKRNLLLKNTYDKT